MALFLTFLRSVDLSGAKLIRYFYDKEYISKMSGYHGMLVRKTEPMPSKDMDIDKLRKDAAEMIDAAVVQGR